MDHPLTCGLLLANKLEEIPASPSPTDAPPSGPRNLSDAPEATDQRWRQRGSVTIWGIGLALIIAAFAGVVLDTWRVFAERQDISGMADAAAIAGATGIDITYLNETGEIRLSREIAEERAAVYLANQDGWSDEISPDIDVSADGATITVVLETDVDFTLLGPLLPGEAPLRITVTAMASPTVVDP